MHVLVLGATGATGRLVVERALEQGHTVTAFARDPNKLAMTHPGLALVQGDVLDRAALDRHVPGHDAVIFTVGPGHGGASSVRTEGARNTVQAMTRAGVQRLIVVSGLGAGITRKNLGFVFDQVLARTTMKGWLEDLNGMEAEIRRSKLDWIVVRPGKLLDIPATRKWVLSWEGTDVGRTLPREDLVLFVLAQLEGADFVRKPVAIGYE